MKRYKKPKILGCLPKSTCFTSLARCLYLLDAPPCYLFCVASCSPMGTPNQHLRKYEGKQKYRQYRQYVQSLKRYKLLRCFLIPKHQSPTTAPFCSSCGITASKSK